MRKMIFNVDSSTTIFIVDIRSVNVIKFIAGNVSATRRATNLPYKKNVKLWVKRLKTFEFINFLSLRITVPGENKEQ